MALDLSERKEEVLLATRSLDSDTWRSYQNNNDSTSRAWSVSATLGIVTTDSDSKRIRVSLSSSNSSNSTNTRTVQIRKNIRFDSAVVIMNTGGNTAGRNVQQHPDNAAANFEPFLSENQLPYYRDARKKALAHQRMVIRLQYLINCKTITSPQPN